MIITAQQKNIRQTPRKLRLVANTVKKQPLAQAIQQLAIIERRATMPVMKVVKQAIANALNNHGLQFQDLVLQNIVVTEGPRYKRFRAVSRGRAHEVKKTTSHVTVTLVTQDEVVAKVAPSAPAAAVAQAPVVKTETPATPAVKKTKSTKKVSSNSTK